jgi:hypothetical protein
VLNTFASAVFCKSSLNPQPISEQGGQNTTLTPQGRERSRTKLHRPRDGCQEKHVVKKSSDSLQELWGLRGGNPENNFVFKCRFVSPSEEIAQS